MTAGPPPRGAAPSAQAQTEPPAQAPTGPPAQAPMAPRLVDGGAIFAGWVGVGMALVVAIAFELILAVQSLVFILAPICGLLIGAYANQRSERWRPMRRVFANAAWAGLVTGVGLAVVYALLRLLFVFADTGYRVPGQGGQLDCRTGPDCTYQRYVAEGRATELAAAGVTDGDSFGAFVVREQINGALVIIGLTLGGALLAGAWRSLRPAPTAAAPAAGSGSRSASPPA